MQVDILIKNGRIIDPAHGIDAVGTIGILANRIVEVDDSATAEKIIDAKGCYVLPGLIDYHTHLFFGGNYSATHPMFLPATGVTAAVDAGTAGCGNFQAFYQGVMATSPIRVKSFLNMYSMGIGGFKFFEDFNPDLFDRKRIREVLSRFGHDILGLKIRVEPGLMDDLRPLALTVELAEELGNDLSVCVHMTNHLGESGEVADMLRPGDIFCHMYQGEKDTILDENGKVKKAIVKARERGVIFDGSNGRKNTDNSVLKACIEQNFYPDIISTDAVMTLLNYGPHMRSLPFVMSKYLSMGMPLNEIVRATTATPAALMKMEGSIGTLRPGAFADVTIVKEVEKEVKYSDFRYETYVGNRLLVPQMTIVDGRLAFCQIDFNLD